MKKWILIPVFVLISCPASQGAIPIAEIIRQAIKRVIVAVDLQVQRLQQETLVLQQAQQRIENILAKTRLEEIGEWTEKQRELYADYYDGLWKVKQGIAQFKRVKEIADTQKQLLVLYGRSWGYVQREGRFSAAELQLIQDRYGKILAQSLRNLEELAAVVTSLNTRQSDADRLERIHQLDIRMQENYRDLASISLQLETLSRQRGHQQGTFKTLKKMVL